MKLPRSRFNNFERGKGEDMLRVSRWPRISNLQELESQQKEEAPHRDPLKRKQENSDILSQSAEFAAEETYVPAFEFGGFGDDAEVRLRV